MAHDGKCRKLENERSTRASWNENKGVFANCKCENGEEITGMFTRKGPGKYEENTLKCAEETREMAMVVVVFDIDFVNIDANSSRVSPVPMAPLTLYETMPISKVKAGKTT